MQTSTTCSYGCKLMYKCHEFKRSRYSSFVCRSLSQLDPILTPTFNTLDEKGGRSIRFFKILGQPNFPWVEVVMGSNGNMTKFVAKFVQTLN